MEVRRGAVTMEEGRAAIQSGVYSLEKQAAERNLMKFNKKQMQSPAFAMGKAHGSVQAGDRN